MIVFATLPFAFEGKRRGAQAEEALGRLNQIADAVICFENDRMGDMVAPKAGSIRLSPWPTSLSARVFARS